MNSSFGCGLDLDPWYMQKRPRHLSRSPVSVSGLGLRSRSRREPPLFLDLTWDEEARSVLKKKVSGDITPSFERPSLAGREAFARKIREAIKRIDKEVRVVAEAAKERNTKKDIKDGAHVLRSLMSTMMSEEVQELLQTLEKSGATTHREDKPTPEERDLKNRLDVVESELQQLKEANDRLQGDKGKLTDRNRVLMEENANIRAWLEDREDWATSKDTRRQREVVTEEDIDRVKNYDIYREIKNDIWPGSFYKAPDKRERRGGILGAVRGSGPPGKQRGYHSRF